VQTVDTRVEDIFFAPPLIKRATPPFERANTAEMAHSPEHALAADWQGAELAELRHPPEQPPPDSQGQEVDGGGRLRASHTTRMAHPHLSTRFAAAWAKELSWPSFATSTPETGRDGGGRLECDRPSLS
jgi:hypothetical protein